MKKIAFLFLALFIFVSCKKFVDEPKPSNTVTGALINSEGALRQLLNGFYQRLRTFNNGIGDDSEGFGSVLNTYNVQGNDIIRRTPSWFIFEYRYTARATTTGRKTNLLWNMFYEIISSCNQALDRAEQMTLSDAKKNIFFGEIRAIRAECYFHLVRNYGHAYVHGRNSPGVPIYVKASNAKNAFTGRARATVGAVYDVIRADLEYAVQNLTESRIEKWAINRNVAYGQLARVYLYMGMYAEAENAARKAREGSGYVLRADQYANGFNDLFASAEWMWGYPQSSSQTIYYGGFSSFFDGNGTRYPPFYFDSTLVKLFDTKDVRYLFNAGTASHKGSYLTTKIKPKADFGEDVPMMRVAEMYLIEAEAMIRQGGAKETAGHDTLFILQKNRNIQAIKSSNTGQALIDEVLRERRKELYGEGLADFCDIRRLGLGFTRGSLHTAPTDKVFKPKDKRFLFLIPRDELNNNDSINEANQNEI